MTAGGEGDATGGHADHGGAHAGHGWGGSSTCRMCPLCSLLRVVEDMHPDAVAHLAQAARHLALAAAAVVDPSGGEDPLEHIDLDDREDPDDRGH